MSRARNLRKGRKFRQEKEPIDVEALKKTRSYKVVRKLLSLGVVSKEFVENYVERMAPVFKAIAEKPMRIADEEPDWEAIRNLFAYNDFTDVIPINAANLCPSFDSVQQTVNDYQLELNLDVSIQKRVNILSVVIDEARDEIATQLGVGSNEIALVRNTSEANNAINNGITLSATDEVLIWDQNHGTNNRAWTIRKQHSPFEIVRVPTDLGGATTVDDIVTQFVSRLSADTKVVTFSHLSNSNGMFLPAKEICVAVHQYNSDIHVHVDGAMTWGAMALDLVDMDCDSYSASAHKWFCGPKEAGILYMRLARVPNFQPNIFAYDAKIILPEELYDDARRFETLGQRSDPTLMGLLNTAEILRGIGYQNIDARIAYLGELVYQGYLEIGFPVTTPADPERRRGVIIAGIDADYGVALYNYLYDTHKIGVASTGGLRASPTILNTESQITMFLDAIKEYVAINSPPSF